MPLLTELGTFFGLGSTNICTPDGAGGGSIRMSHVMRANRMVGTSQSHPIPRSMQNPGIADAVPFQRRRRDIFVASAIPICNQAPSGAAYSGKSIFPGFEDIPPVVSDVELFQQFDIFIAERFLRMMPLLVFNASYDRAEL